MQGMEALERLRRSWPDMQRVSMSSDSFGSLPVFDDRGRLIQYDVRHLDYTTHGMQWNCDIVRTSSKLLRSASPLYFDRWVFIRGKSPV